mgnify:CR=1 FL=1
MVIDWRYTEGKLELRSSCLNMLLQAYGSELNEDGLSTHSNQSLYECAHDWVSQGNASCVGITDYYELHYKTK